MNASITIGSAYQAWRCGSIHTATSSGVSVSSGIHFQTAKLRPQISTSAAARIHTS
jgi:hypothetical protein